MTSKRSRSNPTSLSRPQFNLLNSESQQSVHQKSLVLKSLADRLLPSLLEKSNDTGFALNELEKSLWVTLTVHRNEQFGTDSKFIDVPAFAVNNVHLPTTELHEALAAVRTSNLTTFTYLLLDARPHPVTASTINDRAPLNLAETTEAFLKNVVPADNPKTSDILQMLLEIKTQDYIASLASASPVELDLLFTRETLASHEGKAENPDTDAERQWRALCADRKEAIKTENGNVAALRLQFAYDAFLPPLLTYLAQIAKTRGSNLTDNSLHFGLGQADIESAVAAAVEHPDFGQLINSAFENDSNPRSNVPNMLDPPLFKASTFFTTEGLRRIQNLDSGVLGAFIDQLEKAERDKIPIDPALDLSSDPVGAVRLRLNANNALERVFTLGQKYVAIAPRLARVDSTTYRAGSLFGRSGHDRFDQGQSPSVFRTSHDNLSSDFGGGNHDFSLSNLDASTSRKRSSLNETVANQRNKRKRVTATAKTLELLAGGDESTVDPNLSQAQTPRTEGVRKERKPNPYDLGRKSEGRRVGWSVVEEDLLREELELYYDRTECWSIIIKRHGPDGSISKVLKDRNNVALKDKARNMRMQYERRDEPVPEYLSAVTGLTKRSKSVRRKGDDGTELDDSQLDDSLVHASSAFQPMDV